MGVRGSNTITAALGASTFYSACSGFLKTKKERKRNIITIITTSTPMAIPNLKNETQFALNTTESYARRLLATEFEGRIPDSIPVHQVLSLMNKMVELESARSTHLERLLLEVSNTRILPRMIVADIT